MSSLRKKPENVVVDGVLKRTELSKEYLTLDTIESILEEEIHQKCPTEDNTLSSSTFSTSGLPCSYDLMNLPPKLHQFSNIIGFHNNDTSYHKSTYFPSSENTSPNPSKRFRLSPTTYKSIVDHSFWNDSLGRAQPSPFKPYRQQHFTPVDKYSSFKLRLLNSGLNPLNFTARLDDDNLLTIRSFNVTNMPSLPLTGPPLTPPPKKNRKLDLLSPVMTTGDGNLSHTTPNQSFDLVDLVNVTPPSPNWRETSSHASHPNST